MPSPRSSSRTQGHAADLRGLEVTSRSNRRRSGRPNGGASICPPQTALISFISCPEAIKASICTICKMGTSVQTSQQMGSLGPLLSEARLLLLFTADPVMERQEGPGHTSLPTS